MNRTTEKRVYSCWIVVEPAEDIPGTWVSHCLNFDLVSYGDSPKDAADSVCDAVETVIVDDLQNQRDPLQRGSTTPPECWQRLDQILQHGEPVKLSDVSSNSKVFLAKQVNFAAEIVTVTIPVSKSNPGFDPNFEPISVAPMSLHTPTISSQHGIGIGC